MPFPEELIFILWLWSIVDTYVLEWTNLTHSGFDILNVWKTLIITHVSHYILLKFWHNSGEKKTYVPYRELILKPLNII